MAGPRKRSSSEQGGAGPAKVQKKSYNLEAKINKKEVSECGSFEVTREWALNGTSPTGVIIQEVKRTFKVRKSRQGLPLNGRQIDGIIKHHPVSTAHAEITHYWEAWRIRRGKWFRTDTNQDVFGLCGLVPYVPGQDPTLENGGLRKTTRGSFTIEGNARFYAHQHPTILLTNLGFTKAKNSPAGGLYMTRTKPRRRLPLISSNNVIYTVTVSWNSWRKDGRRAGGVFGKFEHTCNGKVFDATHLNASS